MSLLAQRLADLPGLLQGMLASPPPPPSPAALASRRWILTGTGSSEAHARYLASLLTLDCGHEASYLPLSAFPDLPPAALALRTLVVFSQGISPNASAALARHADASHLVLFTSTTPAAARAAGKPDRALLLEKLLAAGADLIPFPLAEEYTTLIRFIGPLAGYLAALQFAATLPGARLAPPDSAQLASLLAAQPPPDLAATLAARPADFADGFDLVTPAPLSDHAQNLACKFIEGLYWRGPRISDYLQFAHGPFQQLVARPRPVLLLEDPSPATRDLAHRTRTLLDTVHLPHWTLASPALPPYSIFHYESALNALIHPLLAPLGIDQINWPGQGLDGPLYNYPGT